MYIAPILNSNNAPIPTTDITVRTTNIFAGLHAKVKQVLSPTRLIITTPYDVQGDPFYIPIGEKIILEWDKEKEALQKVYTLEEYNEVHDFLRDERVLPTITLSTEVQSVKHQTIARDFYRTTLNLALKILIENELKEVILYDISGSGLSFLYERPIVPKKTIALDMPILDAKNELKILHLTGMIVNLHMIHPRQFRMGVRFDKLAERERDALVRFVNGCTGKKHSGRCKTCALFQNHQCNKEQ